MKMKRRRLFAVLLPLALGAVVAVVIGGNGHAIANGGFVKADVKPRKDIKHDKSKPLRTIQPKLAHKGKKIRAEHRFFTKGRPAKNDPVQQTAAPSLGAPTAGASFDGIDTAALNANYIPPDPNAAVGPNAIVEVVNTAFQVFSKTGASLYGPADTNTLWSGFDEGGPGADCGTNNDGDATISYDRIANRWVLQQFSLSPYTFGTGQYLDCIAVSATNDPLGEWYRYAFAGFGSEFPDYPKLGVWPDAYYVTYNLFPNDVAFDGPEVCAFERSQMLQGLTASQQCEVPGDPTINGLLPSDLDGTTLPPNGAPNHLLGIMDPGGGDPPSIVAFNFHVDWTTPANSTLTGPTPVAGFAPFNLACDSTGCDRIPQKSGGGAVALDSLGDRLMYRLSYRNMGSYEVMVVNHTVVPDGSTATGVRWYELQKQAGDDWFSVVNQGTFAPSDGKSRWMGSTATDSAGNMALGYSISSSSIYPGLAYTGKLASDTDMTQGETVVRCGAVVANCGSQTDYSRWGDYSSMSIDPADDCTFWYTGEYLPATGVFNWKTQIASFSLPNCVALTVDKFSMSLSPSADTIEQGSSDVSTVSTALTSGVGQNVDLTATGMPYHTTVSFSPSSITSDEGSSEMTVDVGDDTPVGTYKISVRGAGASDLQAQKYTLTVGLHNAVVNGDFEDATTPLNGWTYSSNVTWVTSTPSKKSKKAGPTTPTHYARVGLSSQNNLDDTLSQQVVVPTGQSALSFWYRPFCGSAKTGDQLEIQFGAQILYQACSNSKNWIKAAFDTSPYAGQTLTLSFTSHSTNGKKPAYMLVDDVVLSEQLPGIANGNFESGDLTGWQATGTGEYAPTVVSSPARNSYSVRLGTLSNPPAAAGNSTITQAIVVPGVDPVLKLVYQTPCKDVGYDYVLVQIRKNPGGQLLGTLLSTCPKKSSTKWQKASFDLGAWAGQSVTLALSVSNDETIPTVAYFDDVSLTSG